MGIRNIAACFAPSIVGLPPNADTRQTFDVSLQMKVVEAILVHWRELNLKIE